MAVLKDIARDLTPPLLWRGLGRVRATIRSRSEAKAAAEYETKVARNYLKRLGALGIEIDRATILELGPGSTPGAALILESHGARVLVADCNLARWDPRVHPPVLRRLLKRWGPLSAVSKTLEDGAFAVRRLSSGAEYMPDINNGAVDVIFSNAVLEHVADLSAVCRELYRVTKPGGIGFHQIDMRDHRDFSRPLDFLLDDAPVQAVSGSRLRCSQYVAAFKEAGFSVTCEPNMIAEEVYFRGIADSLYGQYRTWPEDDLRILGAEITARRI